MRNSVEIRSAISDAKKRAKEIIDLAKKEVREMTEDEQKEMDGLKETIEEKKRELKELEEELKSYDDLIEDDDEKEYKACGTKEEKNNKRNRMKKDNVSLVKEIRNAMGSREHTFKVNAEK